MMQSWKSALWAAAVLAIAPMQEASAQQAQRGQQIHVGPRGDRLLTFDWPAIEIATATYEDGPTGVTIFRFPDRVSSYVDVRGGAAGTVNTDLLRRGYPGRWLDSVTFAGGSSFGEEAITATMTGARLRGWRSGADLAIGAGAVIYDFFDHRLNDIHPDQRLAYAALDVLQPGVFPLGAEGAGRATMQGQALGCGSHGGQGGAFRQYGDLKIAVFVIANPWGVIVDREGRAVRCRGHERWRDGDLAADILGAVGEGARIGDTFGGTNTTLNLVVVNQRMEPWQLQRLAVQAHHSMGRSIQPYATIEDGDSVFVVSTQEVDANRDAMNDIELNVIISEMLWDAVLSSLPPEDVLYTPPAEAARVSLAQLNRLAGSYRFSSYTTLDVVVREGQLVGTVHGQRYEDFPEGEAVVLIPISPTEFYVDGPYRTRVSFDLAGGRARAAVVAPGPWAQRGVREARR